ncbi:MAG: hypothetical protein ACLU9S_20335 [Oscillospiraceae bacterium]
MSKGAGGPAAGLVIPGRRWGSTQKGSGKKEVDPRLGMDRQKADAEGPLPAEKVDRRLYARTGASVNEGGPSTLRSSNGPVSTPAMWSSVTAQGAEKAGLPVNIS